MDFHPTRPFAYIVNELDSTICVCRIEASGSLRQIQIVPTIPCPDSSNTCAQILCHSNGKYVYCSNRGHDSIACFKVSDVDGSLSLIANQDSQGRTPRNFSITSNGRYMVIANQDTDDMYSMAINNDGSLSGPVSSLNVPNPSCVCFTRSE